jgi:hypothetical protein
MCQKETIKEWEKEFETVTFWVTLKVKEKDSITDFTTEFIDVLTML